MFNLDGAPPQRNTKIGPKSSNSKSSIHLSCGLKKYHQITIRDLQKHVNTKLWFIETYIILNGV